MSVQMNARFLALLALPVIVACGTEPEPKPIAAATPPIDTSSSSGTIRSVGYRNPLGHVQVTDNLFADGDFEWTGRSGQMPWVVFGNGGQGTLTYMTGGQCYSGVRCAFVAKGQTMIGYLATPASVNAEVSIKVKGSTGKCNEVNIIVVDQTEKGPTSSLFSGTPTPEATGWCTYRGTMKNLARLQPILYVSPLTAGGVTVDDAIAEEITTKYVALADGAPPPPALVAEAQATARWFREHRIFGLPRGPHVDEPPKNLLPPTAE